MVHSLLELKAHKDIQKKPILKQLLSLFRHENISKILL
jgi:hypothetical protein